MQRLIHKVGKGPDHAQDLDRDEADAAFRAVVRGEITPLQLGGFLVALRTKGETGVEIAAYARALRLGSSVAFAWPCYAGKAKTFRAVPAAALLLKRLGVPFTLHTYDDAPGRHGTGDLLEALGVEHQPVSPRLHELLELRKELGVRSITNVAARLSVAAERHFISISHAPYFEKYRVALEELGERGVIVFGSEGEPEAPFHGVVKLLRVPGGYETHRPEDYGLRRPRIEEIPAGTIDEEAAITRRILAGDDLPHRTIAVMTAAAALVAATEIPFAEAVQRLFSLSPSLLVSLSPSVALSLSLTSSPAPRGPSSPP